MRTPKLYGKRKSVWLRESLYLNHGIPSHDTFQRVFGLIDAEAFEACAAAWAAPQADDLEGEVVAVGGNTIRRPLHLNLMC